MSENFTRADRVRALRQALEAGKLSSEQTKNSAGLTGSDSDTDKARGDHYHDVSNSERKNFDQKIFMFPESYNALRRELYENWPTLWAIVGWYMANEAETFIAHMNEACDLRIILDSDKIGWICDQYLAALIKKRMNATSGIYLGDQ